MTQFATFEEFYHAYEKQMNYFIAVMVNALNCIDNAHATRMPLPFQSCMIDDCIGRGKSLQEGGAIYNFTGPQGFGIANVADSMLAAGQKVGEKEVAVIAETIANQKTDPAKLKRYDEILELIKQAPKYGNDDDEADAMARRVSYAYTKPLEQYKNPRGGIYQAGLYPVSANVPLGRQTGANPDGRLANTPVADGVGPMQGRDIKGPTATANSVAKIDHGIASNGTLFNQKFHPSALAGEEGLHKFSDYIRTFFDEKGMHMQFNVVSKETLLDAQKHPENYKTLVVRVAGYSALFTTLSKSLQDDIIKRTEQGGF